MNPNKSRTFSLFIIGALAGMLVMYLFNNYKIEKKNSEPSVENSTKNENNKTNSNSQNSNRIDELTREDIVIDYVKKNHELPDYYLTKSEARNQGWNASAGNLCDVLPGKAIGGDTFGNREKQLPKGNQYFEADVNYNCGNRNADRIVFTKNGEVWLTHDHYKSFEKQ